MRFITPQLEKEINHQEADPFSPLWARQALEEVLTTLAKAPRLDERTSDSASLRVARILSRLAHLSGVDEAILRKRLTQKSASRPLEAAAP